MYALRSGFRAVLRQPALILAEIAWRWSFGAAAWVLVVLSFHRILAGIDVSELEYLLARRSDLFLIADAGARIFFQALPAFARLAAILVPALALIWILAATLGRAATVKALLSTPVILSEGAPKGSPESKDPCNAATAVSPRRHFGSLLSLNFVRALITLATLLAFLGAMILAGIAFPTQGANPTTAAVIWVILAALAAFFWTLINWFLALAPIWIVRDGHSPFHAVAASLALYRRHTAAYVSAAWWFGFMRGLALLAAFIAALFGAYAVDTARAAAAVSLIVALLYFAVADFLYIARLAAYMSLADESPQSSAVSIQPLSPEPQQLTTSEP